MIGVLLFPVDGACEPWQPSDGQVLNWQALYPQLDVAQELRKACAWVQANPTKRKTARGMPRFVVNWLNRATPPVQVRPAASLYQAWIEGGGCRHTPRCPHFTACQVVSGRSKAS